MTDSNPSPRCLKRVSAGSYRTDDGQFEVEHLGYQSWSVFRLDNEDGWVGETGTDSLAEAEEWVTAYYSQTLHSHHQR